MKETKKLRRSTNRYILGVIGGFAEYFQIDAKKLRIAFLVVMFLAFVLVHFSLFMWGVLYVLAAILMPAPAGSWLDILSKLNRQQSTKTETTQGYNRPVKDIDAVEVDLKD